ncbi:MAG: twin-arginine translocase TatA/TatE family subunit [Verrucomicrobiota bacterium]
MNTPFFAIGFGGQEMLIILLIVLLLFGAKKLPQLAKGVGKSIGEFKKAKQEYDDDAKPSGQDSPS